MIARPVVFPLAFACPCLTKKLTVIGTIGQTQGITSANRPPSAEAIRNGISPCSAFCAISLWTFGEDLASDGVPAGGVVGWSRVDAKRGVEAGADAMAASSPFGGLRRAERLAGIGGAAAPGRPRPAWGRRRRLACPRRRGGPSVRRREGPLAGRAATLVVADHVAGLAAERLLSRRGARRDLELDAPGDLILVVFHEGQVGPAVLLVLDRLLGGRPFALDLEAAGIEEVEGRIDRARPSAAWLLGCTCRCDSRGPAWRSP